MSLMFKPPKAADRFVLRDYLALDPQDNFSCRLRTAQVHAYYAHLPFNLLVAVLALVVLVRQFSDRIGTWGVYFPVGGIVLAAGLGVLHGYIWKREDKHFVSRADMLFLLSRLLITGTSWAVLIFLIVRNSSESDAMLAVALSVAGIATMAFSTVSWPLGSAALVGVIMAGMVAGAMASSHHGMLVVAMALLAACLVMARAILVSTRMLMDGIRIYERFREQEEVVRLLLNEFDANGSEWLFEFGEDGCLTFASVRMAEIFRRPLNELIGMHWSHLISDTASSNEFTQLIAENRSFRNLLTCVDIGSDIRWLSVSGTPKFDAMGQPIGYRGVGSDVTDRRRAAERIAELATFDSLTGLVNRRIIHQEISDLLTAGHGDPAQNHVALLFVDLDRFKTVNDTFGHGAGDQILAEVARRMRVYISRNGCSRALVGRLGGDEFAITLSETNAERAREIGQGVIAMLSHPYEIVGNQAVIGASIGLAIGPTDGTTVEELMRSADLALYEAKSRGRGTVCRFDREKHEQTKDQHSLELDLRHAIANNELYLQFQPVVDAQDERIVGFEALLRWRHPKLGNIPPLKFIPIAEETGMISEIGAWVLNEACRVAVGWPRHIRCAVNVSPRQFDDIGFVDSIRRALKRWNLHPSRLELELTEGLFLNQQPQTMAMLQQIGELGVGFALDDFGTGYSSLGYLQKIAFRRIKIDRSFVSGCSLVDEESIAIIQAIVALATRLGIHTIAEGTETRVEVETMRSLGCEQMQGYYFGRPMSADDASRLLQRNPPRLELVDSETA